jgi:hypothetical protein
MAERAQDALGDGNDSVRRLAASIAAFSVCIRALPNGMFLQRFTTWAPRDVVAHLIGSNELTKDGVEQIQRGVMPSYV